MTDQPVLSLKEISKTFQKGTANENHVLKALSLDVNKGDFITIIGGNGSGKSTLLNSIAGNVLVDSGQININDDDVTKLKEERRAGRVGRVFQDPLMGTAPRMTVGENLAIALRRGQRRTLKFGSSAKEQDYFKSLLEPLGLGLENRLTAEMGLLSGGQRQSITLLMATMKRPELLLLDEHTAALDPKTAETILSLTNQIVEQEQLPTLMITHNMQDALYYGNRMIMMNRGQVVVDVSGEEKAQLTVQDVMELFQKATAGNQFSNEMLLG
ncbi:ATP-binding cassette domain-containing protein [Desemzia sp. C1]|uniref:Putative ABC transport system ATP-binding protein n=1 Tax=Desemzia incerta TaxID=82801 RepID=A0A1I5WN89_9LACT|nr:MULTISPECIES: ATP-binding cassette domain-containing protein [Desemzia]MCI3029567.1 ATP-binding cassette domain-containing protein [Desemzia sp. C1]SFQ21273.1 putative ABC transport system ATP-binding protein [Desemzia incerta]